jgi:excisionase family DNA binding protein
METQFMKPNDVARILQISRALAYRLMAPGEIQSVRFGRTVRVKPEILAKFIDTHIDNRQAMAPGANGGTYE